MGRDTIADIITSVRNADMNRKGTVQIASTNISENIIKILLQEGFIENVRKHREDNKTVFVLTLRHRRNRKVLYKTSLNLKRISRPVLRIYSNYQKIPRILGRMGIVILSTSRGIMTERLEIIPGAGDSINRDSEDEISPRHRKSNCTIRNNVKTDLTHKKKINRLFESFQPLDLSPEKEKRTGTFF